MLTNARSLSPKIISLHTFFEEHKLDIALITESWLRDGQVLDRDVIDLEYGTNLKILYKNRPKRRNGMRRVGGGVSIVFNKLTCSLRERKITGNEFELVAAVGRIGRVTRPVAVFCAYLEPRMRNTELDSLCQLLSEEILAVKVAMKDPIIIFGGDLNRKDVVAAFNDFADIVRNNHDPTRRGVCLEVFFSNATVDSTSVWPPLETPDGRRSDHDCVLLVAREPRQRGYEWIRKTTRKHTQKAVEEFGRELRSIDWKTVLPIFSSPAELVDRFEATTKEMVERLFPLQTVRCKSNDPPWVTNGIRALSRRKPRAYKRGGKSRGWLLMQKRMDELLFLSRKSFIDRMSTGGTSTRRYFNAVKAISRNSVPASWSVSELFPDLSPTEVGNEVTNYYTKITDQFRPLVPEPTPLDARRPPITVAEVRKKLKCSKKPSSTVEGDIMPRLVKAHYSDLALPVSIIFNAVFREGTWPSKWKTEITIVIPKCGSPSSLSECRNISCTPFLSKVLESILLEDLRREIPPDDLQYGGLKACSINHLLVDLFDKVLGSLDEGNHAAVLGIDFEKAFN